MAILHQAMWQSVWGDPVHCKVRQSITIFGKQMSGIGIYVRSGQGRGQLRYSLRFSAHDQLNTLTQICDGSRLLTIEDVGEHKKQTEIDLGAIRPRLTLTREADLHNPLNSLYLAIGGQAEVFRELCQRYQWHSVRESQLEGVPVWIIKGNLATEPPLIRGLAAVDQAMLTASPTGLIPSEVEAVISTDKAVIGLWLYRRTLSKPAGAPETGAQATAIQAVTEWLAPERLKKEDLEPHLFSMPVSAGGRFTDDTPRYLPPRNLATLPTTTR